MRLLGFESGPDGFVNTLCAYPSAPTSEGGELPWSNFNSSQLFLLDPLSIIADIVYLQGRTLILLSVCFQK